MKKLVVVITLLMALVTFINAYSREPLSDSNSKDDSTSLEQNHQFLS
jgi:hypothetical protein